MNTGTPAVTSSTTFRARSGRAVVAEVRVFLRALAGGTSPVRTSTPLLGAELILESKGRLHGRLTGRRNGVRR